MTVASPGRRELPPGSDEQPTDEPIDDAVDFDVSYRQRHLRETGHAHTYRMMQRVYDQMLAHWARDRYRYTDARTGRLIP